jgi:hypothetical protein
MFELIGYDPAHSLLVEARLHPTPIILTIQGPCTLTPMGPGLVNPPLSVPQERGGDSDPQLSGATVRCLNR